MKNRIALWFCIVLALSSCAAPVVDRSGAVFNEETFASDLDNCRGGNVIIATAKAFGVTVLGSAYGLVQGAVYGAKGSDKVEAAAIGAAVGGTIGLTAGALQALDNHEAQIVGCLAENGYWVVG